MKKRTEERQQEDGTPLAERMRPHDLSGFVGQEKLLGEGTPLRRMIENDEVPSMILWGPPGVGKTTLAAIIAEKTKAQFVNFSAVTSGIKEIKAIMTQAEAGRALGMKTVLFIDEIHRFNKAQQDAFLPYVEKGSITLIGATTENPSFEVNSALLSRCRVFVLEGLTPQDIMTLLDRALTAPEGFGDLRITLDEDSKEAIANYANGDARSALNALELAVKSAVPKEDGRRVIDASLVKTILAKKSLLYDKNGEEHYNIISALHKSMRNSDPDAAVYWLARMLEAGEDPLYVARRVVRFAAEDVGLADANALLIANAAFQSCQFIGMPECTVHLTEAVVYCSLAPKSNALDRAYMAAAHDANETIAEPVPLVIRNAPTKLMGELGYGAGYQYAHDYQEKMTRMVCLPEGLRDKRYYTPDGDGNEAKFKARLEAIRKWKREAPEEKDSGDLTKPQ